MQFFRPIQIPVRDRGDSNTIKGHGKSALRLDTAFKYTLRLFIYVLYNYLDKVTA